MHFPGVTSGGKLRRTSRIPTCPQLHDETLKILLKYDDHVYYFAYFMACESALMASYFELRVKGAKIIPTASVD